MKPWILILCVSFFAASCGQKAGVTPLKVTIAGINAPLATTSNFMITMLNEKSGDLRRVIVNSSAMEISLPNGPWIFNAYHWQTGADLNGTFRCAQARQELTGEDVSVALTLTTLECDNHSEAPFFDGSGFIQEVGLLFCTGFPAAGTNCNGNPGVAQSYKIVMTEILYSTVSNPSFGDTGFGSECININEDGDIYLSGKFLPAGNALAPFPFTVLAYPNTGCSGTVQRFNLAQGLRTPDTSVNRIHDNVSVAHKSWVYLLNNSTSGLAALEASFSIPAESFYPMNLNHFVTGAVGTVTFTEDGAGSVDGAGVYTHDGSTQIITVTATDDAGGSATFSMDTKAASSINDFNTLSAGSWASARALSGNTLMSNSSTLSAASPSQPRFYYDNVDGNFGFLSEGPRTNHFNYSSTMTGWINDESPQTSTTNPIIGGTSIRLVDTNSGASGYSYVTPTGLTASLPYTFSVFVQKSSGIVGFYVGANTSDCSSIAVNIANGTSMATALCNNTVMESGVDNFNATWWRVWMKVVPSSSIPSVRIYPAWNTVLAPTSSIGATGNVVISGLQFEQGVRPTSLVTAFNGTQLSEADQLTNPTAGSGMFANQGTMLLKWRSRSTPGDTVLLNAYSTAAPSSSQVRLVKKANDQLSLEIDHAAGGRIALTTTETIGEANTAAIFSYDSDNIHLKKQGSATVYSTSRSAATAGPDFDNVSLGSALGGATEASNQLTKKFIHWDAKFPPAVLKQIVP